MSDADAVQVAHAVEHHPQHASAVPLRKHAARLDLVEQVSAGGQLQYQLQLLRRLKHLQTDGEVARNSTSSSTSSIRDTASALVDRRLTAVRTAQTAGHRAHSARIISCPRGTYNTKQRQKACRVIVRDAAVNGTIRTTNMTLAWRAKLCIDSCFLGSQIRYSSVSNRRREIRRLPCIFRYIATQTES